jgi:Na+/melibiose symporter-like transporter
MQPERLPTGKKVIYAAGQFGWSLASFGVANLINYFYAAPGTEESFIFPPFIYSGAVLAVFTIVGLLNSVFRIFDGITDPIIANASDRARSRIGKRKIFMAIAGLPFAILSVLVFVPPVAGVSNWNALWLGVTLALFYLAMTAYVVPYTALISEYGHDSRERLNISTMISITWALGAVVGNLAYTLRPLFVPLFGAVGAFQVVLVLFGVISAVAMYLPVIFIDEPRYALSGTTTEKPFQAFRSALANRDFRFFVLSDFMYWLALTFIQTGIGFYVITLLELPEGTTSTLLVVMFALSFAFYLPVNLIAKKIGRKRLLLMAYGFFALVFAFVAVLGVLPGSPTVQAYLLVIIAAVPISIFGILPNAIIADIADADATKTGNHKAAVFFGSRGLVMKLGIAAANLIFPSLLLLGRTAEQNLGVRLTGVAAVLVVIAGALLLLGYREDRIVAIIEEDAKE